MEFDQALEYVKLNAYTIGQEAVHGNETALKIIILYGAFNKLRDANNRALLIAAVEKHNAIQKLHSADIETVA